MASKSNRWFGGLLGTMALLCLASCGPGQSDDTSRSTDVPPISEFEMDGVVTDASGRVHYIVNLRDDSADGYPKVAPNDGRFPSYHKPEVRNLIYAFEAQHGVQASSMTSWVGVSFSAFMTPEQADELRYDPRVKLVSPDYLLSFSADALSVWTDQTYPSGARSSWGKQAVNQSTSLSNGETIVYVVDSGVGFHPDLNVAERINATNPDDQNPEHLVGCYPHATHVAGIIGGRPDNDVGVFGINPGARIISVSVMNPEGDSAKDGCLTEPVTDGVIRALDWIRYRITKEKRVGIVNISMNPDEPGGQFAPASALGIMMKALATPAPDFAGAFISHSAGNQHNDACSHAYGPSEIDDGIIVVGAINDHGQPVVPLNGLEGFRNSAGSEYKPQPKPQTGSNYGACVEVWAPGDKIYSSWAPNPQSASTPSEAYTYRHLSGTSMAAPHVAGLAAYLAETQSLTTPEAIEQAIRKVMYPLNSLDPSAQAIHMPSLNQLPDEVPHSTPYAEIAISQGKFSPAYGGEEARLPGRPVLVNGDLVIDGYAGMEDSQFTLSIDSWGAGAPGCDVQRVNMGSFEDPEPFPEDPHQLPNGPPNGGPDYFWPSLGWGSNLWIIQSSSCPSAHATVDITVRQHPQCHWFVDGNEQLQAQNEKLVLPPTTNAVLSYTSGHSVRCDLRIMLRDENFDFVTIPGQSYDDHGLSSDVPILKDVGTYNYEVQCFDEVGSNEVCSTRIQITLPEDSTQFISQAVPQQVTAGHLFPASVTFKNTGMASWTADSLYLLGSQGPQDNVTWGNSRQYLAQGEVIAPDQSKTFTFNSKAPDVPGIYTFQWQMLREGVGWFGDLSLPTQVEVQPAPIEATSGSWYNPARSGWGLSLSRDAGGVLSALWTTYTAAGTPVWYLGTMAPANGMYTGELRSYQWVNGAAVPTVVGQMTLATTSPTTGTLSWVLDGAPGSEPVVYYAFGSGAPAPLLTGTWHAPSQSGWSQVFDVQGSTVSAALALYDVNGKPTWVFGTGTFGGASFSVSLQSVMGTNLCPACSGPTSTSLTPAGSLQVQNINAAADAATINVSLGAPWSQWNQMGLPISRMTF